KFTVANPNSPAARVRLGEVPLAWAEKFVPNSKFAGTLSGAALEVSFRSVDDLAVNFTEPLVARGVTASLDGKPALQALDVTADLSATKHGETIGFDVRKLELKQGAILLATLAVTGDAQLGGKLAVNAKGNLDADLAQLMNQPAAASFATLARGQLSTTFDAKLAGTLQADARLTAKNLISRQNGQPLGDLDLTLKATAKPDGSGTIEL